MSGESNSPERTALREWTIARAEYEKAMGRAAEAQEVMRGREARARAFVREHGPTVVSVVNGDFTVHCDSAGLFAIPRRSRQ